MPPTGPQPDPKNPEFRGLDDVIIAQLLELLGEKLVQVFASMKVVEDDASYTSADARDRLVKAFAAMGTLAQTASSLDRAAQDAHIVRIEKALRSAMIAPASEVAARRLIEIDRLWEDYERISAEARAEGTWRGEPPHEELENARYRMAQHMGEAAEAVEARVPWGEWVLAVAEMVEAAAIGGRLRRDLDRCIKEADSLVQNRRRDLLATFRDKRAVVLAVAGLGIGIFGIAVGVVITLLA